MGELRFCGKGAGCLSVLKCILSFILTVSDPIINRKWIHSFIDYKKGTILAMEHACMLTMTCTPFCALLPFRGYEIRRQLKCATARLRM